MSVNESGIIYYELNDKNINDDVLLKFIDNLNLKSKEKKNWKICIVYRQFACT